jgi:aryl-alcohol dehydrogenase-like predicted oxidoreductase
MKEPGVVYVLRTGNLPGIYEDWLICVFEASGSGKVNPESETRKGSDDGKTSVRTNWAWSAGDWNGTWRTFDVVGRHAEENARAVVDQALAAGANFFDSSPMYGRAERVLGDALGERRERAIVATKVWTRSLAEGRAQISRALTFFHGHVDLYQIHNLLNWQGHLSILEQLKEAGTITAIGATHYSPTAFDELCEAMKTGRIATIQIPYNPQEREVERTIFPLAADLGLGVVVMRPFGVRTWPQVLLKWILSDPRCHIAIPATSQPARMQENALAGDPPWFGPDERAYVMRLVARYGWGEKEKDDIVAMKQWFEELLLTIPEE